MSRPRRQHQPSAQSPLCNRTRVWRAKYSPCPVPVTKSVDNDNVLADIGGCDMWIVDGGRRRIVDRGCVANSQWLSARRPTAHEVVRAASVDDKGGRNYCPREAGLPRGSEARWKVLRVAASSCGLGPVNYGWRTVAGATLATGACLISSGQAPSRPLSNLTRA
ncbi:hypothetical protein DENSPDRAFT_158808 [Dentipellis sp. KUC8613]|nr:hypothetical protein DENSPDRAFT_158808 [Dentipellis sp. KUC8613]